MPHRRRTARFQRRRASTAILTAIAIAGAAAGASSNGAAEGIDEIIVTATKRLSALQHSALAVTVFDQHRLDALGADNLLDVQLNVPNVLFSNEQFSLSTLSIRGIGRQAVGVSADSGAGIHFNGAYLQYSSLLESEFYDLARIELLRGPQGTLYGRNTTAGVLNIIAAPPHDEFSSAVALEVGDFDTRRASGHVNVPAAERLQLRVAGMRLERDGHTRNTFSGNDIDDRELWSLRGSARATITTDTTLTLTHQRFRENDRRMRTSKQYCATDPREFPFNTGCLPGFQIDTPGAVDSRGQLTGILASAVDFSSGMIPGGLRLLPMNTNAFADARVPANPREVHADFDPEYFVDESVSVLALTHDALKHTFEVVASHQNIDSRARTDLDWTVPQATFTPGIPGVTDTDGNLSTPMDPTVSGFSYLRQYDSSSYHAETNTVEARVASDYVDHRWNFLAGAFYLDGATHDTLYDVHANVLAVIAPTDAHEGAPVAFFRSDAVLYRLTTGALFGDVSYDMDANTRISIGARYTRERKLLQDRQTLLNTPGIPEVPGVSNRPFLTGDYAFLAQLGIADPRFHGFGTSNPNAGELNNPVPPYRRKSAQWREVTGRAGIERDLRLGLTDSTLAYLSVARSYKSGGINPASLSSEFSETFAPEFIDSLEIGAKNRFARGRVTLNGAYFLYDYSDLQISKIIDRTSVNENIDARVHGLELELHAAVSPALRVSSSLSLLHSRITGGHSVDPADPTDGDPTWTAVKNATGDVYLIPTPGSGRSFAESDCGAVVECAVIFEVNPVSTTAPSAAGADTPTVLVPIGVPMSLAGKQLPNAPEFSANFGIEYGVQVARGFMLVPRLDYYYQSRFFYRAFNTRQDRIPSWDVVNLSLTLHEPGAAWDLRVFANNVTDGHHITGAFLADGALGAFTNVFLREPRTMGARFTYRF
jgi:iron complex outermembrane recepter protein